MPYKVVNSRSNTKHDMKDTGDPDELLGEGPRKSEIAPGHSESDNQDENKENDGVCIEREVISCIIDTSTTKAFVCAITLKGETRDGDETEESEDQLGRSQ